MAGKAQEKFPFIPSLLSSLLVLSSHHSEDCKDTDISVEGLCTEVHRHYLLAIDLRRDSITLVRTSLSNMESPVPNHTASQLNSDTALRVRTQATVQTNDLWAIQGS